LSPHPLFNLIQLIAPNRGMVRNGLAAALLARCPIRLKSFAAREIGRSIVNVNGTWCVPTKRRTVMPEGKHIRGREAAYMAIENDKRKPPAQWWSGCRPTLVAGPSETTALASAGSISALPPSAYRLAAFGP
jgi:hypothetical protein